jgi:hypothetical protein
VADHPERVGTRETWNRRIELFLQDYVDNFKGGDRWLFERAKDLLAWAKELRKIEERE